MFGRYTVSLCTEVNQKIMHSFTPLHNHDVTIMKITTEVDHGFGLERVLSILCSVLDFVVMVSENGPCGGWGCCVYSRSKTIRQKRNFTKEK